MTIRGDLGDEDGLMVLNGQALRVRDSDSADNPGSPDLETQYDRIRQRYTRLHQELKNLRVLDHELQKTIQRVEQQFRIAKREYETAMAARGRLVSHDADSGDRQTYEASAPKIDMMLSRIERDIDTVLTELRRAGASTQVRTGREAEPPKVRPRSAYDDILDRLTVERCQIDSSLKGNTINQLEQRFVDLRQRREKLKSVGPWMMILAIYAYQLETPGMNGNIPDAINIYRNIGGPASKIYFNPAIDGDFEKKAQSRLDTIASNLAAYAGRVEWLEELERKVHEVVRSARERSGLQLDFPDIPRELAELGENLSAIIDQRYQSLNLLDGNPPADAYVRIIQQQLTNDRGPRTGDEFIDMATSLIMHAAMKKGESNQLQKPDIKRLLAFFAVDPMQKLITATSHDPEMKASMFQVLSSVFKIVSEVNQVLFK